jgi:hypothetical protein
VGVAQGTRLYQFIGGPTFEALFANYDRNPAFLELPGDLVHSEISFFSKYQARTLSHNLFIYILFVCHLFFTNEMCAPGSGGVGTSRGWPNLLRG